MDDSRIESAKQNGKRRQRYPFLLMLVGSVVLLATLMMPFASATKEAKTYLLMDPDRMYAEELGMTNREAVNVSLVDYVRIYKVAVDQGIQKETAIAGMILIGVYALFSLLVLLFSALRKAIPVIVFDLLTLISFWLIHFDFKDRGVIPGGIYDWGIVNYLVYIIGVLILAGAVWLLVEKQKDKSRGQK